VVELRGVRHRYDGRLVLNLDQFAVPAGAQVAVVGHNGSGKSTLLRLLALLEAPTEGTVLWDGTPVPRRPPVALRRRVTLVEQRPILLRGSVLDNLGYGLRVRGMRRTAVNREVETVAEQFGLTPLLERRRHELSDGEVQRVAVARALAVRPELLLLDEPASSADRAAAGTLYRALAQAQATQATPAERPLAVCIASHQLEDAYRWADDIRALAEGRLSPVTPENLFRVELRGGGTSDTKHARVGTIDIAVATDRTGPVVLAVPPTDIFVSREPLPSSARNVFSGRVTRIAAQRPGGGIVHVTADVGVELVAVVTAEAARDLALAPDAPVVFSFKASAVRVF
jgi:tungstate transport system ATP-binding protein